MASVHLGRWVRDGGLSRLVALKAIHPHLARDDQHRRAFVDEARLSMRIRHPNVVPTLDLVEDGRDLVMVMDFVPGLTLSTLSKRATERGERVPVPVARRLAVDLLRGLQAAHITRGADGEPLHIVHRDISPDNLLVGEDGRARVIDFGIAYAEHRSTFTATGIIKGKLRYLAPEQLLEGDVDGRTDVYAASVVLWQLLTGERLFGTRDDGSVIFEVVRGELRRPRDLRPELPEELNACVMRGLATKADARWPSAEAMADAIEASGATASHREVAQWTNVLGDELIEGLRRLGRAVETAPPISERGVRPAAPGGEDEGALVSAVDFEPETVQERSRTQLTSQADVTPAAPIASPWSTVGVVALTLVVGVAATVAVLRPAATAPTSAANGLPVVERERTALPPPPLPRPSTRASTTATAAAAETVSQPPTAPSTAPMTAPRPPPAWPLPPRRPAKATAPPARRLPTGI